MLYGALRRPSRHQTRSRTCLRTSWEHLVRSSRRPFSGRFSPPPPRRGLTEVFGLPLQFPVWPGKPTEAFAAIAGTVTFGPISTPDGPATGERASSEAFRPPNPSPNMPANLPEAPAAVAKTGTFSPFSTSELPAKSRGGPIGPCGRVPTLDSVSHKPQKARGTV